MKRLLVAFGSGLLFALGLGVSGMTHPSKVLAFLDFGGDWDPSLALVMGVGLVVNAAAFRWARRLGAPLLEPRFVLPRETPIDARLMGGAATFGVGWGLGGFCPGPALVSIVGGAEPVILFVAAMLVAMATFDAIAGHRAPDVPEDARVAVRGRT